MRYILSLLTLLFSFSLSAQVVSTTITKDLDTVVLTKSTVGRTIKVGSFVWKDTTIVKDTFLLTTKKYNPPSAPNVAPVANPVSSAYVITLPVNSVVLNGDGSTDSDGVISTYTWSKITSIAGTISSPNSSRTDFINLAAGIHKVRLTVIDNKGASNFKEINITVNPAVIPPTGTTINLSFNPIPYSDPDIISPGRGAEQWHNSSARIPNPTESQPIGTENSLDVYHRFEWWRLEGATEGSYTWQTNPSSNYFDNLIKSAIDKGQKFSFGIMTFNGDGGGGVTYPSADGGGESAYPLYLHKLMQAEATNSKDWKVGNEWVPNWNSANYLGRLRALHEALNNHVLTTTYKPTTGPNAGKTILLADAIYVIDIRGYGNWGEWHSGGICNWNDYPSGRQPTASTLKTIIDHHTQVFKQWPLAMMIAAYDGGMSTIPLFVPLPEVAHYALTARNDWGEVGARRDQVGAPDGYLKVMLEGNILTYQGSPTFATLFMRKWQNAPITGEPNPGVAERTGMVDLLGVNGQIQKYHHVSFGNGNYPFGSSLPLSTRNNIREGFKRAGYRVELKSGGKIVTGNNSISITLNWQNVGITPTYEDWDIVYELVSSSGSVVPLGVSSFRLKLFIPQANPTVHTDTFSENVTGAYILRIRVVERSGYRAPFPLAIQGRTSIGAYNLATGVNL